MSAVFTRDDESILTPRQVEALAGHAPPALLESHEQLRRAYERLVKSERIAWTTAKILLNDLRRRDADGAGVQQIHRPMTSSWSQEIATTVYRKPAAKSTFAKALDAVMSFVGLEFDDEAA